MAGRRTPTPLAALVTLSRSELVRISQRILVIGRHPGEGRGLCQDRTSPSGLASFCFLLKSSIWRGNGSRPSPGRQSRRMCHFRFVHTLSAGDGGPREGWVGEGKPTAVG